MGMLRSQSTGPRRMCKHTAARDRSEDARRRSCPASRGLKPPRYEFPALCPAKPGPAPAQLTA
jgi:hypothetical protein